MKEQNNSGKIFLTIILIILMLALLTAAVMYIYNFSKNYGLFEKKPSTSASSQTSNILNENDAIKIGKEKYEKALKLYNFSEDLKIGDNLYIVDDKQAYEITNYNEIMNANFSANGIKEFETVLSSLVLKQDGKAYKLEGTRETKVEYKETELLKKSIEENKIIYTAKSKYVDPTDETKVEYKETEFILVKTNNNWLVESFKRPN